MPKLTVYAENKEEIILALSKITTQLEEGFLSGYDVEGVNWDLQEEV